MSQETLHQQDFGGHTVWVTVRRPAVFDPETNQYIEKGFICAFKIGSEPKMTDGEFVKEGGKPKFFQDHNSALCAAFDAARRKIHQHAQGQA
ncbi:MAG TPA: hypothetical protein VEC99_11900 [Clostridia bacterium]|nr:hypothetical protein [Clostridia bacterium]